MEPAVTGLALVVQNISTLVTAVVTWIGSYMGAITASGNELLMIFFALPLVGIGIGALKRIANG